jgi:hypothetical protein
MRLAILDSGHTFQMKVLFAFIRAVSRLPVPDAIKLNRYRPDFYGMPMRVITHEARTLGVVGRGSRADGSLRVADQCMRSVHKDARRGRGARVSG